MKRLIALHILVYSICFGVVGLQSALDLVAIAELPDCRTSMVILTPAGPSASEVAYSEGIGHYQTAVALERAGSRGAAVLDNLRHARERLSFAIAGRLPLMLLPEAYFFLGDSYLHGDRDPVEAEHTLRRATELDPRHRPALVSLARAYSALGLWRLEAAAWERALSLDSGDASGHAAAAEAHFATEGIDRLERAYDHALEALAIEPSLETRLAPIIAAYESPFADPADLFGDPEASLAEIIDRSPRDRLSDDEADRYTREIGQLLGAGE